MATEMQKLIILESVSFSVIVGSHVEIIISRKIGYRSKKKPYTLMLAISTSYLLHHIVWCDTMVMSSVELNFAKGNYFRVPT